MISRHLVLGLALLAAPAVLAGTLPPDGDAWSEYADAAAAAADGWFRECAISQLLIVADDCQCGEWSVGVCALRAYWCDSFGLERPVDLTQATHLHFWHRGDWQGWNFQCRLEMQPTAAEAADGVEVKRAVWEFPSQTTWTELSLALADATWNWRIGGMWRSYGGTDTLTEMVRVSWSFCTYSGVEIGDRMLIDQLHLVTTETAAPATPRPVRLGTPRPNPFNPLVTVAVELDAPRDLRLTVHDLAGRRLRVLHDGPLSAGRTPCRWDGRDAGGRAQPSGVYLLRLEGDGIRVARKLTLAR